MIRNIGTPATRSHARPIEIGHLYWGIKVTEIGYTNGGIKTGTVNVDCCKITEYPVWEGFWPNGTRVRVKDTGEAGHVYDFTPEGVHYVYGGDGEFQNPDPAKRDTYIVMLDKDNNSHVYTEYHCFGLDEIAPISKTDPDYEFIFPHALADAEFQMIAEGMVP